jgi:DNA-binding GntR family transcriptional regulator
MYTILERAMRNDEPRPKSIGAAVADLLRDAILTREFVEGERLPELRLCEKYGVSRIPLREAFQILASEGLLFQPRTEGLAFGYLRRETSTKSFI